MKMIKLSFRKNLIYLVLLTTCYLLRRILSIIMGENYQINNSLILIFIMFLGEIIGGLLVYRYQISFLNKNKKDKNNLAYKFTIVKKEMKRADNWPKIALLIYFASYFDLIEFFLFAIVIPNLAHLSNTSTLRLYCIYTIESSILCYYTLRFQIYKHQIFSLMIMGLCLSVIISLEIVYRSKDINLGKFILSHLLVFCHFILKSFTDVIERYLYDYDFLNPLLILMMEGIFGFITSLFYSLYQNPFKEIITVYNDKKLWQFIILIFLLLLYSVLCAGLNIYKILCNVLYSPMTKSLSSYFLNSAFIIYYFISEKYLNTAEETNFLVFFINLILSILIDFTALIYNEIIILDFCGLAKDTHMGIAYRADVQDTEQINNILGEDDDYFYNINESDDKDSI